MEAGACPKNAQRPGKHGRRTFFRVARGTRQMTPRMMGNWTGWYDEVSSGRVLKVVAAVS